MRKISFIAVVLILSINVFAQSKFSLREDGTILKDDQPFFPMGFYIDRGTIASYKTMVDSLAAGGTFNLINLPLVYEGDAAWTSFLDYCAGKNVFVLTQLSYSDDFTGPIYTFRNHPAIYGWSVADDADNGYFSLAQLEERNTKIKTADPNHVSELSLTGYYASRRNDVDKYTPIADVSGLQLYPITPYPDYDVTAANALTQTYARILKYVESATKVNKPMLLTSQNFKWGSPAVNPRYPTAVELRNMTYSGLAAGIKGIASYVLTPDLTKQTSLWNENKALRTDITTLESAILNGTFTRVNNADPELVTSYWANNEGMYIVVVNTSYSSSKTLSLTIPSVFGLPLQSLFERMPNTLSFSAGILSGTIAPTQVEVYFLKNLAPDYESPSVPTGLIQSSVSLIDLVVSWNPATDNSGSVSYKVYNDGVFVGTTADTTYNITGLSCGSSYTITVVAADAMGNLSAASNALPANTDICDLQPPSIPTGLAASAVTSKSFTLSWSASTDNYSVKSYEVFKDGVSAGTTTGTSLNIAGLIYSTPYSMTVTATDASGNTSDKSAAYIVTTAGCTDSQPPSAPATLYSSAVNHNSFTLIWTAATDNEKVTGYEVYKDGISVGTTTTTKMNLKDLSCETDYAFTVKAFDLCSNKSDASSPLNVTTKTCVYEVEDAVINGGVLQTNHTGYSGTGFWADVKIVGDYASFTVNSPAGGNTPITCRYSAGNGIQKMSLYVNGTRVKQTTFSKTANWDTWSNKVDTVMLNEGANTIKYQYDASDNGNMNIDYIWLAPGFFTQIENLKDDGVCIFPNPSNSTFAITNVSPKSGITVTNVDGKTIVRRNAESDTVLIDAAGWGKGVYLFYILTEKGMIVKKAIVN